MLPDERTAGGGIGNDSGQRIASAVRFEREYRASLSRYPENYTDVGITDVTNGIFEDIPGTF